jgi:hypothetical protein
MSLTTASGPGGAGSGRAIPILRTGILAREVCRGGARAEVAAVFERSLYLRSADRFVCIGEPTIGNGPITLIADFGAGGHLSDLGLHGGCAAVLAGRSITIGNSARFTFGRCELWRPPAWRPPRSDVALTDVCDGIIRLTAVEAPEEGFAQVYRLPERGVCETPLLRIARPRIAHFKSWLYEVLDTHPVATNKSSPAIEDLIGLGPGLTPSGDDFLVGALALLDARAEAKAHAALAAAITQAPRGLTSPLSDYLLRAAARGHVGEPLWRAVAAVVAGEIDKALPSIRKIGHGSGWDMLVGVVATLQVVTAARALAA